MLKTALGYSITLENCLNLENWKAISHEQWSASLAHQLKMVSAVMVIFSTLET